MSSDSTPRTCGCKPYSPCDMHQAESDARLTSDSTPRTPNPEAVRRIVAHLWGEDYVNLKAAVESFGNGWTVVPKAEAASPAASGRDLTVQDFIGTMRWIADNGGIPEAGSEREGRLVELWERRLRLPASPAASGDALREALWEIFDEARPLEAKDIDRLVALAAFPPLPEGLDQRGWHELVRQVFGVCLGTHLTEQGDCYRFAAAYRDRLASREEQG